MVFLERLFTFVWSTWYTILPPSDNQTSTVWRNVPGDYARSQSVQSILPKRWNANTYKLPLQVWIQWGVLWKGLRWVLKRFGCFHLRKRVDQGWDVEEFNYLPRTIMNFNRLTHPRELATTRSVWNLGYGMLLGVNIILVKSLTALTLSSNHPTLEYEKPALQFIWTFTAPNARWKYSEFSFFAKIISVRDLDG